MATRYTLKDISNMTLAEIASLNKAQLRAATRALADVGNKRLKRLQESGIRSAAYEATVEKGKFTTSAKSSRQELQKQFARAYRFVFTMETSTVTGAKNVIKKTAKRIGLEYETLEADEMSEFWQLYREIEENSPGLVRSLRGGSAQAQQLLFKMYTTSTATNWRELINTGTEQLTRMYEYEQADENPFDGGTTI